MRLSLFLRSCLILGCLWIAGAAIGPSPAWSPALQPAPARAEALPSQVVPEQTQRQLRIFRRLWSIINERYLYPDFNGLDWGAVRDEIEAGIGAGWSDDVFYDAMRGLIARLNDDHSSFLSPDEARAEEEEFAGAGQFVGIGVVTDINPAARRVFVLQVIPDSPAARAGIQPHDHLLQVDGAPLVDPSGEVRLALLRGAEGTTVTLTVRTPGQSPREVVVRRARLSSAAVVEHRLLQDHPRIGYILIPTFFEDSVDRQVRAALRNLMRNRDRRLDGLILDMRINGGGAYDILVASLGFFTGGDVGSMVDRHGVKAPVSVRAEHIGNSQSVPLAVLIGPSTQSYAEVFAGVLRDQGRAKLVGQPSGGNVETLIAHTFEDGSVVWIAEETFHLPGGANWEGQGLRPDVRVSQAWDEFTLGNDPALAKALALLQPARSMWWSPEP